VSEIGGSREGNRRIARAKSADRAGLRERRIARAKSADREREIRVSRRIARGVLTRGQLLSGQLLLL